MRFPNRGTRSTKWNGWHVAITALVTLFIVVLTLNLATGEKHVWLRATGSTAISQLVDSFVVLYIAFVLGPQKWPTSLFLAVSTVNYAYKMLAAIALLPLLYLMRHGIRTYLGHAREQQLREEAASD